MSIFLIVAAASCGGGGSKSADAGANTDEDASASATCPTGQELCGSLCVETNSDRLHCGSCDAACDTGEVCDGAGSCELSCQAGLLDCGGSCVDPDTDEAFCGATGNCQAANAGTVCVAGELCNGSGVCALNCQAGRVNCGGTCVDANTDEGFCGATGDCLAANAGTACAAGELCDGSGACALNCQAGLIACGGTCVDPSTDEGFCGATADCLAANAGVACAAGELCDGSGVCALNCQAGLLDCGGICTNPNTDEAFCGATTDCLAANAGVACAAGELCDGAGVCATTCQAGLLDCNGTCIDPDSNPTFCGASTDCQAANAGTTCAVDEACSNGSCALLSSSATCAELVTDMDVWGEAARGFDLRPFTNSTLHWMGCTLGCTPGSFYCDDTGGVLSFGTSENAAMRALLDPGDATGDTIPASFTTCCSAANPTDVCNSLDSASNGSGIDSVTAFCRAIGYQGGTVVREETGNSCPEVNALDLDGADWSSDFVNSQGHGAEFQCTN